MTTLQIITNYTPRSHVLCGEALKDVYANFRMKVLREVEWATWHYKLSVPGGKGWCIRKANLPDLERELKNASIPYAIAEHVHPPRQATTNTAKKVKGPPSAYNLFTQHIWSNRDDLVKALGEDAKKPTVVSKYIAKEWKKVAGWSVWHAQAKEMALNFKRLAEVTQHDSMVTVGDVAKMPWSKATYKAFDQVYPKISDRTTEATLSFLPIEAKIAFEPVTAPPDSYEYKWDKWAQENSGRGYETKVSDKDLLGRVYKAPMMVHHFIVYDDQKGMPVTMTVPGHQDTERDFVFRTAWTNYFSGLEGFAL